MANSNATEIIIQAALSRMIGSGKDYAVIKPLADYDPLDCVDWAMVSIFFNTDEIHHYGMLDKLIITV